VPRVSRNVAVVVVAVTAILVGAGLAAIQLLGSSDASSDLDRFELKSSDLPAGYRETTRVEPAAGCSAALNRVALRRLRALGVAGCAVVKYRRQERNSDPRGLVFLLDYLFDDVPSASAALAQLRMDYLTGATGVPVGSNRGLPVPALGDQAPRGIRLALGSAGLRLGSGFVYLWRREQIVAVLAVFNLLLHDFGQRDALALARRIDQRATN
jgi:hypothetical protein